MPDVTVLLKQYYRVRCYFLIYSLLIQRAFTDQSTAGEGRSSCCETIEYMVWAMKRGLCCRSEAMMSTEEGTGQQRRFLPWKQSFGQELGMRRAESILRKWQVCPPLPVLVLGQAASLRLLRCHSLQ